MTNDSDHKDRADKNAIRGPVDSDFNSADVDDEFLDRPEGYDEIHLFRKLFGFACLSAVFFLVVMVIRPMIDPLLRVVL